LHLRPWADLLELETSIVVEDAEAVLALTHVPGVRLKSRGAGGSQAGPTAAQRLSGT
jgi:hypothetical protein